MNKEVQKEVKKLIKKLNLNCLIKEFKNKVNWIYISRDQKLSESFIREFENKVHWYNISIYQNLSESFIREFESKVNWNWISSDQKFSESFIREFESKVSWNYISYSQNLSESFIREFKDRVYWDNISRYQVLSKKFREEFKDKIDNIYEVINEPKTITQKTKECKEYAEKHNLKIDKEYLYAFRNHDEYGRGVYSKVISYKKGQYYKDWHCDMRKNIENSFGLGIWPQGNTKVKVKIEDWGVAVNKNDGKARVWGFEIV
jgi:hypothetical protein